MTVVLGVDGSRGRWVCARVGPDGVQWSVHTQAASLIAAASGLDAVGIDVPIGVERVGDRAADVAARARLHRSGASVFATPTLAAFTAALSARADAEAADDPITVHDCWAVAHAAQRRTHPRGMGFSKQAWGLAAGILDVDAELCAAAVRRPSILDRVVEVHPECSYRAMAGAALSDGGAVWPAKKSAAGAARRVRLAGTGLGLDADSVVRALDDPALVSVPVDDALDALAAAWSARRWANGIADVLGDPFGTRSGWSPSGARLRLALRVVV